MAKNRELKTRADGIKQHYNTGSSVTSNADARAAFNPRPAKERAPIVHGAFEGASHLFRPAPEGYQEATVVGVHYLGLTRSGEGRYELTADNGFEFESTDGDLAAFTAASPERPVRVAYSTAIRRGSDLRRIAVTGEATPRSYARPLAGAGLSDEAVAEAYRSGIPAEFASAV